MHVLRFLGSHGRSCSTLERKKRKKTRRRRGRKASTPTPSEDITSPPEEDVSHTKKVELAAAMTEDVHMTASLIIDPNASSYVPNGKEVGSNWVRLNVGGTVFQTTKQTLSREANSFLARLCQEESDLPSEKDETGAFLIDRDALYFSPVLNYLRHGKLVVNTGLAVEGVLEEADFYNLPGLSHLCAERIHERDNKAASATKHVYRVLQCHEEELTTVVSAVSDGWKFEQLIPIGAFSYSTEQPPEYLCVVSREFPDVANGNAAESHDRAKLLQQKARRN